MTTATHRNPLAWATKLARKAAPAWGAAGYPRVAEANDVRFHTVERLPANEHVVRLEGLVFHSALAVAGIKQRHEGDSVIVEVRLTPSLRGRSGRFAVDVPLEADTRRIVFGRDMTPVWLNGKPQVPIGQPPGSKAGEA